MLLSYKNIIIVSTVCFILTIIFGFAAYQSIFELVVRNQVSLRHRNYLRQIYLKFPITLDFRVYFFNVTNPQEVHKGGTPILKEVGPYCYDLYKERIDIVDNDTEDSLTYTPYDIYKSNQERCGDLSQDDYVTIIHPLIVGMVNYVATKTPQFISVLNVAMKHMFPNNTDMFLTAKVRDILFEGIPVNCTSKDFATMGVCTQLKMQIPGLKTMDSDKNVYKIALLGQKNGTVPVRVKVLRGIRRAEELGTVLEINNKTESDLWPNEECNKFKGTDGWIFPAFAANKEQIWFHAVDLCTNLHADFVEDNITHNMWSRKYFSDFEDVCVNCSNECPLRGLLDVTKCTKVPLFLSLPHFLRSDEKLLQDVIGLSPETEKHIIRILIEKTLSVPLEAQIRAQFNFPIQPVEKIEIMKTVPELIHPLLWIELGVDMNGWLLKMIQGIFCFLTVIEVLKYLSLIISLVGIGYGCYLYRKNKKVYKANDSVAYQTK